MPRLAPMLVVALALVGGCASVPKLIPQNAPPGRYDTSAAAGPVTIRVVANAWRGYPESVEESFTPIWVHLINGGEETYDITFQSLTLVDESGRLYPAIPPMEVVRTLVGQRVPLAPAPGRRVASADFASDVPMGLLDAQADPAPDAPRIIPAQFGFGLGMGPAYDPMMGPYDPMMNPWDPMYSPYAYPPPTQEVSGHILKQGFREGRLLPRTHAMGFVYFQRAYDARELTLRLEAASEMQGRPPAELSAQFTVQH